MDDLRARAVALLGELDAIARDVDSYEYGLPVHGDGPLELLVGAVVAFAAPRWVPVAERVSDMGVPVLVAVGDRVEVGWYYVTRDGSAWWQDAAEIEIRPSHWMPLPAPPA